MAVFNNRYKTRKEIEEEKKRKSREERFVLPTYEELSAIEEKAKEDAARVASSEKGLDFFQRPSNWDDGYQFGDVTKTALGTLGDVGVNAVKGVVRMGEGIGDAAQYGAAALADLFGADEKAEAIRQNAQRDKVAEAFSGVDEKLNKYSVLGRSSDAAVESLGQIGGIIGTAGAVGATAATTGAMGLSSFGSGTGEAYAAGAKEGEAEAYGAIAGAADALSEMIFGGLGKGFKALGLSKGIASADDVLAKAVTSKIRNTLAKNTVQLGIKAGAEGLEEVLAGTMQAAGKKATYMSERDFADIIKDENLLEQFVVGAMASGIAQTPSFVSATRVGVDLVSDGGTEDVGDTFAALRNKNADFAETERTGLASGANEDDIRMAGELSSVLGKKIRFFREDAKNGTINNGEYHEDTGEIWINTRSKNVKAQIVAHELTHSIEKNDGYRRLVDLAMNKLEAEQKAKGKTLDDLYREKETLYADGGVRLASYDEITSELVAEYVEKRLLTDEASIKSLVSENRTLGQRIREWFDSLLAKMGNVSAKEREYIRQMRDVYARALGENVSAVQTENKVKNAIGRTAEGQNVAIVENDILGDFDLQNWNNESKRAAQKAASNALKKFSGGISVNGINVKVNKDSRDEFTRSNDTDRLHRVNKELFRDKMRTSDIMNDVVTVATDWREDGDLKHGRNDKFVKFERGTTLIAAKNNKYKATVVVGVTEKGEYLLYDVVDIEPVEFLLKNTEPSTGATTQNAIGAIHDGSVDNSISQDSENVNSKFSVSRVTQDSDGRQLSEGQQEYFRDSKVTDANGNLKVMYHGTQGGGFYVFDPAVSDDGISLFFTDRNDVAMSYSGTSETYAARTFRTADDLNRFFSEIGTKEYSVTEDGDRFVLYEDGNEIAESDTADGLYEEFRDWSGLDYGDVNYKVYLNLKNPFVMDSAGRRWNQLPRKEFRTAAHIKAEDYEARRVGGEFRLYRKSDGKENTDGIMQVNQYNENISLDVVRDLLVNKANMILDIKTDTELTTRYVAKWAKKNGYDGVVFNNIVDSGQYSNGSEGTSTVAIAFSSEQIKSVDNQNPTSNPDIRYSVSKDDSDKRVMPKKSAAGTKARARQEQQARMQFEKKVMNRGFDKLSSVEQEHYREEIVGQYRRKYNDYKKKRDALIASGYQFAGVDDYVEKVVGSVEDAAIDANTFLIHYQEGVFGDPAKEDVQEFALDYLQMLGAHRPDTSETYIETQDSEMPSDEDAPPMKGSAAEYGEPETIEVEAEPKLTRKVLHKNIIAGIKKKFEAAGFDLDKVFAKAKDLSTFATVDNTPPRVMEKSLGYKEGKILADATVNQAAKNETEGIRWLNQFTDRKDGVLAKLSKKYNIKPGSKESAAAQMYAEGFWVNDKNEIVEYGDRELAADFPDAQVRENIKGLAHDPIIRQIYDETLDAINASRTRNAFPEIQKLDNYYLHFRAMDDTFSRLGIPFNPNDIRAKDLPTDLNGVTADLKPGQPYFASAKHRLGKRTSFDLLGGMEKYLTSAKNQIYHIDDIQTLRALRNYVADMYGQAEGLSNLDELSDEEVEARIKDVYNSHLSTFAKFLNEEANILAGKTSLIDRGLEGVIGRRGITFLNDVNRQVGANMVGYNISSAMTNFLAPVQAFAKMNKAAFVKGFAQTVENRLKSITGNGDDFAQRSDVIVRRKGADRFHRTAWQKMSDPGYLLMGMVDDISTEIIARAKYNELTAKGMDAETANRETDKWVSRLMGDRSLGQMPQIFNSKMLGLVTKFQLEVRNQLDSQFYDTIKEAQVQYEEIGDKAKRNAKITAKVAATFAELAIAQHLFGAVFESIAGYNPAFDIIEVLAKVIGLDDDEESEDTVLDNIEQGVLALIEDLPYSSVIMDGGRIPVSSAMPIGEFIKGQDEYGNGDDRFGGALQRLKTVAEAVPYYALPGGYGQIKKTAKGLSMFLGDKEVTGSYTDSGDLRFPVEATPGNIAQAAVFGQWANENARDYFDNERKPANKRQTMGYAESGLEWKEYQKYREQISKLSRDADKLALIKSLDIDQSAKEALYRFLVASAKKDDDGNIIGSSEDDRVAALYASGLNFGDYADAKLKQAELNADESLTANQRATRFYAWAASEGYTDEEADVITEQFKFSSGFKVEPTQYKKLIGGGVSPENAVLVTDALSGTSRAIDKINAIWSTGLTGAQLDNAVKAVVTEGWYERYRKVIDANVPLDVLTWVLDNADVNGNDSIDNEERTIILSQLALSRKELSALWEATGGSEKSNPYSGNGGNKSGGIGVKIEMPKVEVPKIEMPKIELPKIGG